MTELYYWLFRKLAKHPRSRLLRWAYRQVAVLAQIQKHTIRGNYREAASFVRVLFVLPLLLCGCASIHYSKSIAPDGTMKVSADASSLFSNSAIKGLQVDYATKTTTNGFKVSGTSTEPNPESITASGTALGELIGAAAKTAVK